MNDINTEIVEFADKHGIDLNNLKTERYEIVAGDKMLRESWEWGSKSLTVVTVSRTTPTRVMINWRDQEERYYRASPYDIDMPEVGRSKQGYWSPGRHLKLISLQNLTKAISDIREEEEQKARKASSTAVRNHFRKLEDLIHIRGPLSADDLLVVERTLRKLVEQYTPDAGED